MNFRFSPRAESEAEKKASWWRKNRRYSPDLFDDELAATIERITKTPDEGAIYPSGHDVVVRRLLMPRTKNHVYYAIHEGQVVILSVPAVKIEIGKRASRQVERANSWWES